MTGSGPIRRGFRFGALLLALVAAAAWAAEPERGPKWASLSAAQRQALAPLQQDWSGIDLQRKRKWLELAARFPSMPAEEQQLMQQRMTAWARLSPSERAQARLQFQEAQQIPSQERQARWEAYQALTPDERQTLIQRARPAAVAAADSASSAKRNTVPAAGAPPVRTVAPTIVQAGPGATTTSITARANRPPHQQPGMPKIAATRPDVNPATLLPQRGPQGAAAHAPAASDAAITQ